MFYHGVPITGPGAVGWAIAGVFATVMIVCVFARIIIRMVRGDCHRRRSCGFYAEQGGSCDAASTILDERYAKGELGDEEYKRKKEILNK